MFRLAPDLVALSVTLAIAISAGVAAIGLYRADVCFDRRRLLVGGITAGVLIFPLLLLIGGEFHMRLNGGTILWMARLVAVWMALVVAIRLLARLVRASRWADTAGDGRRIGPAGGSAALAFATAPRVPTGGTEAVPGAPEPAAPARRERPWVVVVAGAFRAGGKIHWPGRKPGGPVLPQWRVDRAILAGHAELA